MKKGLIFVFLPLLIAIMTNVMAITTDIKESYAPGETVLIKISGNILEPITKSNMEFKRNNVLVPLQYDVKKLGEDYYVWFITPSNEINRTYALIIKGISTTELGQVKEVDYAHNFSLLGNLSSYYINPGFIVTKEDFSVEVYLNEDFDKEIETDFPETRTLALKPGKNTIDFSTKDVQYNELIKIKIGDYDFLAYINRDELPPVKKNNSLEFIPGDINSLKRISDKDISFDLRLKNDGANKISEVYLNYNKAVFDITNNKVDIDIDSYTDYEIKIKNSVRNNISEIIYAKSDKNNITISLPIEIKFIQNISINRTTIENITENQSKEYYCVELDGESCLSSQKCEGESVFSLDGACCIGKCSDSGGSTKSNSWVGYLLIGILILIIAYAYIRYKKVKPNKNVLEKTIENKDDEDNLMINKKSKPIP